MNKAKAILASIPLSVLSLLVFYLIYGIVFLIISLVFWLISYIPILNILVDLLLRIGENSSDMVAIILSSTIAYYGLNKAKDIIKQAEIQKYTLMFTGICLIILNALSLIINLMHNDAIIVNIVVAIVGIAIFYKGKTT